MSLAAAAESFCQVTHSRKIELSEARRADFSGAVTSQFKPTQSFQVATGCDWWLIEGLLHADRGRFGGTFSGAPSNAARG